MFIEIIQLYHGVLLNMEFHQERFERTRREVLGLQNHPRLAELISIPAGLDMGQLKCRVSYGKVVDLIEYERQEIRKVNSLKLVYSNVIEYAYKYADRSHLQDLYQHREDCDDILVIKQNCISDSFYANVIFWDGADWITPDTPLLAGTMRAFLLNRGLIREERISPDDLHRFKKFKLINAMNGLGQTPELSVECIHL